MKNAIISLDSFVDGIQIVNIDWRNNWSPPNCHPYLFLCSRGSVSDNCQTLPKVGGKKVFQHGIYIMIADQKNTSGKFNVSVGSADGEKGSEFLFDLLKKEAKEPCQIPGMKDWHTAIVVCDWENDIPIKSIKKEKVLIESKRENVFKKEIDLVEKMTYEILRNEKIFNVKIRGTKTNSVMANPASNRYNYYIYSALRLLADKFPFSMIYNEIQQSGRKPELLAKLMQKGEFCPGEKLQGDHDSHAIVSTLDGYVILERYKNSQSEPQIMSINQATDEVRKANERQGTADPKQFWYIKRNSESIELGDLL